MAWSSLFWGAVLGLFLVIQAASLAHDKQAYPPPGRIVEVLITQPNDDTSERLSSCDSTCAELCRYAVHSCSSTDARHALPTCASPYAACASPRQGCAA